MFLNHFSLRTKENSFAKAFSITCLKEKYVYEVQRIFLQAVQLIHTTLTLGVLFIPYFAFTFTGNVSKAKTYSIAQFEMQTFMNSPK